MAKTRRSRDSVGEDIDKDSVARLVSQFGTELGPRMRGDGRDEDRLRQPVASLLQNLGGSFGLSIVVHDEVTIPALNSRPDMAIDGRSGRIGYVELKAPSKGVPPNWRPRKHDKEQWEKLKTLPNLLYTNGYTWSLFRKGELIGRSAFLQGDLSRAGASLVPVDSNFESILHDFLQWFPERPRSLRAVVADIAPLCRLLRDQVVETLSEERGSSRRPFSTLAAEWRGILFPHDEAKGADLRFADAYAQSVTFGFLLARVDGVDFYNRSASGIAEQLAKKHSLLGESLSILANPRWVNHLSVVDTLIRVIGRVDWDKIGLGDADTYATLYENFLGDYNPSLRRQSGTYYTPAPVARAMVRFVDQVLKVHLKKKRGFASEDVITLDPSMGAGTFLAEILECAASNLRLERGSDSVPEAHLREIFARRLVGFELQVAPYAVAELRLHAALKNRYGVEPPTENLRFLTNALDDPDATALDLGELYRVLRESRERGNRTKRDVPVMVLVGNPPWRERSRGSAPWIEKRRSKDRPFNAALRPSLDEFRYTGTGRTDFNLNNMWTYFWRWATWKAFEANEPAGVVAFITPSPYMSSDAFVGMRNYLRQTADFGWIIDLSPEEHRPGIGTRVFPETQHQICIGVFARAGEPKPNIPATVYYRSIRGSQQEKFDSLLKIELEDDQWSKCPDGWTAPFRPSHTEWENFPLLSQLLPWRQPGVCSNRNWVWSPSEEALLARWASLTQEPDSKEKGFLFKETRDRVVAKRYKATPGVPSGDSSILNELPSRPPIPVQVGFRSFDRQFLLHDRRVVDAPRPELWQSWGEHQVYAVEQHSHHVVNGPAIVFSALVPNIDFFNGRGGRVLPLYRDSNAVVPNLPPNLLKNLSSALGLAITAEQLLSYTAAVTSHPGFTLTFNEQLKIPGVRIPLTRNRELWAAGVEIGQRVLWLHTYGERMSDEEKGRPLNLEGCMPAARYLSPIRNGNASGTLSVSYDGKDQTITIGEDTLFSVAARIHPVREKVWNYEVGGVQVIKKWLDYRQASPRYRRRTSPLDDIASDGWTADFDDELLRLLFVLDECVKMEDVQAEFLRSVCADSLITSEELHEAGVLPAPPVYQKPPKTSKDDLLKLKNDE